MRSRLIPNGVWIAALIVGQWGCGRPNGEMDPESRAHSNSPSDRQLFFVGFDASEPLVNALKQGKLQGLVLQDPYKMGNLGVKTLVDHLEKKDVHPKVSTGEILARQENMQEPGIRALLDPPQAENLSEAGSSE